MQDNTSLLGWFLGPKAENESLLEDMMLLVLRDYCHWRRNYFPSDKMLITRELQRELAAEYDNVYQNLLEMMAELRRNFPFYSPRYIGHMLSDTSLPAMIGYFAGLLYNPNNVTTEAAPVTVDMEIDACNLLLEMLGFNPPPEVPESVDEESIKEYKRKLEREFGWGHLTLGGTTANLEALWVARKVKYMPLCIWDVARRHDLEIPVKLPADQPAADQRDIRELDGHQLLLIKPNESVYLLAKYIQAYRKQRGIEAEDASNAARQLLEQSEYSLKRGLGRLMSEFPPVLFVPGTAHYSIQKAADILGIGTDNVEFVSVDAAFRMSISDLRLKIERALSEGRVPLAVIPIVGTTEEGAVDPVHDVLELREFFEEHHNASFWVHVDAAWGGYLRSLFNLTARDETYAVLRKISQQLDLSVDYDFTNWNQEFFAYVGEHIDDYAVTKAETTDKSSETLAEDMESKISSDKNRLDNYVQRGSLREYRGALRKFISNFSMLGLETVEPQLSLMDRIDLVNEYVSDEITLEQGDYYRDLEIRWGAKEVCSALVAMDSADSVTIDPHKMGYVNYPCGMVAFKNDRVRHFILQRAPYITSVRQDVLIHMPPRHVDISHKGDHGVVVEAFAPFIVEGSRPGASASALWLTTKTIPPTIRKAGSLVKASLLAARELHEWLVHWDVILKHNQHDADYEFVHLTQQPPDTNVVIFTVKKKTSNSLSLMNDLTRRVYERFAIQAELGDREYSYVQPYFLSKTECHEPFYPYESLESLFRRCFDSRHLSRVRADYRDHGLTVLRATVMNPYINLIGQLAEDSVLQDFILELSSAAEEAVAEL